MKIREWLSDNCPLIVFIAFTFIQVAIYLGLVVAAIHFIRKLW